MARFVDFKDSVAGMPIMVNPDHVVQVQPSPDVPVSCILHLSDGSEVGVEGELMDVISRLQI